MVDHPGHGLAAIDRIEDDALRSRQQGQGIDHARRRQAIARADMAIIREDMLAPDHMDGNGCCACLSPR
ncbi:MAG: hypothetical protein O9333_09805 [Beijerinckiaceae bacterium]|nr:hypothetical protein [Beijerinckiaceae bacterium]